MNAKLIETHAHLYAEEFDADRTTVVAAAVAAGVAKIYLPNVDAASIPRLLATEQEFPSVCEAMMGLHPCYVKENFEQELAVVETWLNKRKFAAIGEIGMDFYWDLTYKNQQEEALKIQLQWAAKYALPVVIHCRNSTRETIETVKKQKQKLSGIFHCFSGTLAQAQEIIALGFAVGIGGVATFKNGGLDKILPYIDLQHLVLETDCPYLAPIPHRGKRNEPAYLPLIAKRVAELKNTTVEHIAETTTANALSIFKQG
jgi:TatD DNase family protein